MTADWGTEDPAIGDLLKRLQGSVQIPFLAVFPAGHPEKVIPISGLYKRKQVIEALRKAGPSQGASVRTARKEPASTSTSSATTNVSHEIDESRLP